MGIFSKGPVFFQKYLKGYKTAKNSPVMKKLLSDNNIAKALDEPRERQEFYNKLKEYEAGGITKEEIQKTLGFFRSGKGKFISGNEAFDVARKMMPDSNDRYKYSSTWDCGSAKKDSLDSGNQTNSSVRGQISGGQAAAGNSQPVMGSRPAFASNQITGLHSNPTSRVSNISRITPSPK